MTVTSHYASPVGRLVLAGKGSALVGAWIEGQKYFPGALPEEGREGEGLPVLEQAKGWLDRYFAGERPDVRELALAPEGSEFQKAVWEILCAIPYGETRTYGWIAKEVAVRRGLERMSAQAVGGAVGHNPISIVIPCHRVVGTDGSLTGYAGGLEKKIRLLAHEGVDVERFFRPKEGTAL